jgi:radical SAM superfamily enzyme YgiQ (UPF0313 family)
MIAPYIHDFAAYDLWVKPLGLLYLAAAAENAGYRVRIVNCLDRPHPTTSSTSERTHGREVGDGRGKFGHEAIPKPECLRRIPRKYKRYGIPQEVFLKELSEGPKPDVIGVGSMMTYWYGGVRETIETARSVYPDVPVILGGVYATVCADHARKHSGADIVVEGPGEEKFIDILGEITGVNGGERIPIASLRPAYHLLHNAHSVSMLTSFGCPFSCAYCASRILRGRFIQRPVRDVMAEIGFYIRGMGMRDIAFYDDAFLINADGHIKPLLRDIAAMGLNARFHTPNGLHPNLIDEELARLMGTAGFATIRLSVESIHEARLRDSCMKVTPTGFEQAVNHLTSAGYAPDRLQAYVLMGTPGQRPEEVEETIRFVHKTGTIVRLADFSPIPGTQYFAAVEKEYGLDLSEPLLQNNSVFPHLVPGLCKHYQELKTLAISLNAELRARGSAAQR